MPLSSASSRRRKPISAGMGASRRGRSGLLEDAFEEGEGARAKVVVLGFFRRRYYIATCVVDAARRVCWTQQPRHFDDFESAETAFVADG